MGDYGASCQMTSHQPLVWYRAHAPGDSVLEGLEKEAWEGRKGI